MPYDYKKLQEQYDKMQARKPVKAPAMASGPMQQPGTQEPSQEPQNGLGSVLNEANANSRRPGGTMAFLGRVGKVANAFVGSTARSVVQLTAQNPAVAEVAGLIGGEEAKSKVLQPRDIPILGEVKPLSANPEDIQKHNAQTAGETALEAAGIGLETGVATEAAGKLLKKPLTQMAERLYQSALKPGVAVDAGKAVKTGLEHRIWLTQGGVEKAASKIDDFESQLENVINSAASEGKTVSTKGMQEYVNAVKDVFGNTVDVKSSDSALKNLDDLVKSFSEKYGDEIPIQEAQKLKVNTMRALRDSYGELTTVSKEGQKQMARFLKDKIVEKAPVVGEINGKLKNLYNLDKALEGASRRIGNLNLLGLGSKIGAAAGGKPGAIVGLLSDLTDKAAIKSGAGIALNDLAALAEKGSVGARIPLTALLNYLQGHLSQQENQ